MCGKVIHFFGIVERRSFEVVKYHFCEYIILLLKWVWSVLAEANLFQAFIKL